MRVCRLIILSAFLVCVSLSAKAQYTSKSSSSGFTSKTSASAASQPQEKKGNPYTGKTNAYTNSASAPVTGNNSYTNQGSFSAEKPVANVRPAAAVQVRPTADVFRPKSKMAAEIEDDSGDDLPSFDALEDNGKPKTPEQQKQIVKMQEEPKGEILIYISDFTIDDSSRIPICEWVVNIQNDTNLGLQALSFEYQLSEDQKTLVYLKNVPAGGLKQKNHASITPMCAAMKQRRLKTINLKKCKIGDVFNQDCMKFIKFK